MVGKWEEPSATTPEPRFSQVVQNPDKADYFLMVYESDRADMFLADTELTMRLHVDTCGANLYGDIYHVPFGSAEVSLLMSNAEENSHSPCMHSVC